MSVGDSEAEEDSSSVAGPSRLPEPSTKTEKIASATQLKEVAFNCMPFFLPGWFNQFSLILVAKDNLPNWHLFSLHPRLNQSLHSQNFLSPTPIQARALPPALACKDVVGVAETGSGKTLAYGLPILHALLQENSARYTTLIGQKQKRRVRALVLAPTRELALQVSGHLNACLNDAVVGEVKQEEEEVAMPGKNGKGKGKGKQQAKAAAQPKAPPVVSVAAIVGGMSAQKQKRILDRGVDVMVATPGRLWDILQEVSIPLFRLRIFS